MFYICTRTVKNENVQILILLTQTKEETQILVSQHNVTCSYFRENIRVAFCSTENAESACQLS